MIRASLIHRFSNKVLLSPSGCWEWQGAKNEHGYGVIGRGRRIEGIVKAHRLSFEIFNRVSLKSEQCVCHACDNPSCVSPHHLFLGSQQDNLKDMRNKQRGGKPPVLIGELNAKAKLDEAKVHLIFKLRHSGLTTYQIAEEFGVSRVAVCSVLNRKTWRHINVKISDHIS